jgi:hypothetical protein
MREVERDIEAALAERMAAKPEKSLGLLRTSEEFAINNMKSLAIGAAGAILSISSMMLFWTTPQNPTPVDPVVVGSILPSGNGSANAASHGQWRAIQKPTQILTLEAPQFAGTPPLYQARRNDRGDQEDALIWQAASPARPEARVTLTRSAAGGMPPSLFIDMTRQQAERGLAVKKAGQTGKLETKFGTLEVADMTFADGEDKSQACLAFRSGAQTPAMRLSGWYCAPQGAAAERPELGCFLDRLTLLKSGQDKDMRRFFTEAEQNRKPCATARVSSGRKPTWLDADGKAPGIRGDITGSIGASKEQRKQ